MIILRFWRPVSNHYLSRIEFFNNSLVIFLLGRYSEIFRIISLLVVQEGYYILQYQLQQLNIMLIIRFS